LKLEKNIEKLRKFGKNLETRDTYQTKWENGYGEIAADGWMSRVITPRFVLSKGGGRGRSWLWLGSRSGSVTDKAVRFGVR